MSRHPQSVLACLPGVQLADVKKSTSRSILQHWQLKHLSIGHRQLGHIASGIFPVIACHSVLRRDLGQRSASNAFLTLCGYLFHDAQPKRALRCRSLRPAKLSWTPTATRLS